MQPRPMPALTWVLMLAVAVVGSNSLALSPILGDVATALNTSPVAVARANAAYGGGTAVAALAFGGFVDRIGPMRLLLAGLPALALAMLASAGATHWTWLAVSQGAAGAAAGVLLPAIYACATSLAPDGRGAETLGRVLTGWSVSLVVGVPASAFIASTLSWRASYIGFAILLALATLLLARQSQAVARPGRAGGASLRDALREPGVRSLLIVCLLFMTAFYGVYAYLGDHLRGLLGLSATEAGFTVLAYGAGFGFATFGDRLIDRIGAGRLFPLVLAAVALVYASMLAGTRHFGLIVLVAALWGFANHFGLNILVLQLTRAARNSLGAVLALNSATSYGGALLGTWAFGLLYEGPGFDALVIVAAACTGLAAVIAGLQQPGARLQVSS